MNPVIERSASQPAVNHPPAAYPKNGDPKLRRWTRDEYYKMAELGFFHGKRVELIEGEIVEMSPMKTAHATAVRLVMETLREIFNKGFVIDSQLPMSFGKSDEPEPDVAVVAGSVRDYSQSHPKSAALIVEISDTTLNFDRTQKAVLYARNNIPDYWILNLKDRCLEVYRLPVKDKKLGYIYTEIRVVTENDSISPLAKPESQVKVANLLP
ncbi:MAG: Uma2 family endonuclease [Pyrinomonadaceae bacterium]